MNQILYCDWLLEWAKWYFLALVLYPAGEMLLCHIINVLLTKACSVKMAGFWPHSFAVWLWTSAASQSVVIQKKELDQYLTILTSCLVKKLLLCMSSELSSSILAT